ncbi:MAG: DUF6516 family protein [Chloroflexota bacterium]
MSDAFRTPEDYELFLYSLVERFSVISRSTLVFVRLGATMARVSGEVFLQNGIRVVIRERVVFNRLPLLIDWYGYEIWQGEEKLYWYDSQPHPTEPGLQATHPHHKHIPPDIKHNRIPAPKMRFDQPNIPWLIEEAGNL